MNLARRRTSLITPISGGVSLDAPASLAVTGAVSSIVADPTPAFTWDAVSSATAYDLEYGKTLTGTPTVTGVEATGYTVPIDQANYTQYQVAVRARSGSNVSDWSEPVAYTVEVNLLLDSFSAGSVATGTRAADVGYLKIVDTNSINSLSNSKLLANGTPAAADGLIASNSGGTETLYTRTAGRTLRLSLVDTTTPGSVPRFGWSPSTLPSSTLVMGADLLNASTLRVRDAGANMRSIAISGSNTLIFQQCAAGGRVILKPGAGTPKLLFRFLSNTANAYAKFRHTSASATTLTLDDVRIFDHSIGDFDDALIHKTPTNGQLETGQSTGQYSLAFTLPAGSANLVAVELRYRVRDASNYLSLQIKRNAGNTAWDLLLIPVTDGTPGSALKTVTGVGTPSRLTAVVEGNSHEAFTEESDNTTSRGTTVSRCVRIGVRNLPRFFF
jgi:hypothetical protein